MSNWSSVILAWSGIDKGPDQLTHQHRDRLRQIDLACQESDVGTTMWTVTPACPASDAPALACEFVAVTHINHFSPTDFLAVLRGFKWSMPDEVQIMWKSEQMEGYRVETLEPTSSASSP